jgi:hypothetical protein
VSDPDAERHDQKDIPDGRPLPVLAIVMPVLLFPFARDLWLAFDLMFRPPDAK